MAGRRRGRVPGTQRDDSHRPVEETVSPPSREGGSRGRARAAVDPWGVSRAPFPELVHSGGPGEGDLRATAKKQVGRAGARRGETWVAGFRGAEQSCGARDVGRSEAGQGLAEAARPRQRWGTAGSRPMIAWPPGVVGTLGSIQGEVAGPGGPEGGQQGPCPALSSVLWLLRELAAGVAGGVSPSYGSQMRPHQAEGAAGRGSEVFWKGDQQTLGGARPVSCPGPLLPGTSPPKVMPRLDHHTAAGCHPKQPVLTSCKGQWSPKTLEPGPKPPVSGSASTACTRRRANPG